MPPWGEGGGFPDPWGVREELRVQKLGFFEQKHLKGLEAVGREEATFKRKSLALIGGWGHFAVCLKTSLCPPASSPLGYH